MAQSTVTAKITRVKRLQNSVEGNPTYQLVTEHGTFKTATNAGFVYGVQFDRLEGKTVTLEIGGRGTVTGLAE